MSGGDSGEQETCKDVRFERAVHALAGKLGICSVLDRVELETKADSLKPVECKRQTQTHSSMDEIQLCVQGLCLKEMAGNPLMKGTLGGIGGPVIAFSVVFSGNPQAKTSTTIVAARECLSSGQIRRLITVNAAKPVRWWKFASRSYWGSWIGAQGMWSNYVINELDADK
ncbi:hypothetical protein [Ottowia massiliensis]|jgi:CRISPR-associated protein Cas4|uniref:hypothetical protein n=1 Tax=Ottowia massiliensis TaxID=2045302 RepID=UPI0018EAF338|nr:hypothetical protein [Ottowia massiliensis]